ncbi:uncharacterized protein I206_103826 [Kwoniella pini CBS 10737]|uniref:Ubiquitin carboxyl-terminal hydrolase n=1 Tax=Kwoniella pini CBS 10737 TaxID=1296096 RepID=A0A1B9HSQ6_9TREE|nr:uncharacterized protein I206_07779 [Kwoniella pini CBS 10737]OCF46298.1 hypothetical protein I206_07779 [Kwoniella pini CBS 10737]
MPPKKGIQPDWSWIEDVSSPDEITPDHRRLAAGLGHLLPCPFNYTSDKPQESRDDQSDDEIFEVDSKGNSKSKAVIKKVQGCAKKGCKNNPRCYNHLGAEAILRSDAKQIYLDEHAEPIPIDREGPAGLRNLGATCYANAFLQLWYHNVAFRNGVYDCVTTDTTPLYQLAIVFGMLQHSNRQLVDPMGLIDALRLEKGNQQDAAEFSKLFMSVLASEFAKNPDPKIRSFLKEQFEGEMEYVTTCECGYESKTTSTFLELEFNLKDKTTLEDCLNSLKNPEILEGDNLYNCPACMRKRKAIRQQTPTKYPPVIHMALMRFVFNIKTMSRKKSPASITYPKEIYLGGDRYDLRAVITHEGKSAHHGHFICEVYDESQHSWLLCNDEEVKTLSDRPAKRPRLSLKLDNDTQTSTDAYMLVYKRREISWVIARDPPSAITDQVISQNLSLEEERNEIGVKREQLEDEFGQINGLQRHPDRLVPRHSLFRFLDADSSAELYGPFDFASILCAHGGIDPEKAQDTVLISEEAFDQIQLINECPQHEICSVCIETEYTSRQTQNGQDERTEAFEQANQEGEPEYVISKIWYDEWKQGNLPAHVLPTSEGFSLYCEHGDRRIIPKNHLKKTCMIISAEALAILKSIIGEFQVFRMDQEDCDRCSSVTHVTAEIRRARIAESRTDRQVKNRHLNPKPPAFCLDYFALSPAFVEEWEKYMKGDRDQPEMHVEICPHGGLDWDPQMEPRPIVDENGWDLLVAKYGQKQPVVLQFGPNTPSTNKTHVDTFSPGICDECCTARRTNFDLIDIPIIRMRFPSPSNIGSSSYQTNDLNGVQSRLVLQNGFNRGMDQNAIIDSRTRKGKSDFTFTGTKETSIKDLKVHIMNKTQGRLTPIQQKLYYKGKELASEDTIGSISFLLGDHLNVEEIIEDIDIDSDVVEIERSHNNGREEGFSGTALFGRIPCPDCTFENDGAARSCEMCMRPLQIDHIL